MKGAGIILLTIVVALLSASAKRETSYPIATSIISNKNIRPHIYEGFYHIYNFNFKQAKKVLNYTGNHFPNTSWTYVLGANYYWWKYQTGENTTYVKEQFYYNLKKASECLKGTETHESKFLVALITAFKARINVREGKYIASMTDFMKHVSIISSTMGQEKDFKAFYLTSGLYHYLTAAAYRDYVVLRPFLMLIPQGEMNRGIYYLAIKKDDLVLDTESKYFLMKIFADVEHNAEKAEKFGKYLSKQYPSNWVFRDYYYKSLKKNNHPLPTSEIEQYKVYVQKNNELSELQKKFIIDSLVKNFN